MSTHLIITPMPDHAFGPPFRNSGSAPAKRCRILAKWCSSKPVSH